MKHFFIIIIFFFLALLQTSFLIHFPVNGVTPNIVLICLVLFTFFFCKKSIIERDEGLSDKNFVFWFGFWAGLFLDFFYALFFGAMIIIFILISIGIKKGFYILNNANALSFSLFLFLSIIFYNLGLLIFSAILGIPYLHLFQLNLFLTQVFYNLIIALPLFYIIKFSQR